MTSSVLVAMPGLASVPALVRRRSDRWSDIRTRLPGSELEVPDRRPGPRSRPDVTARCHRQERCLVSTLWTEATRDTKAGIQMRVAVAGGTGLVGRHVVASLSAAGDSPVILARSTGVDITTGEGLDAALRDVDALIDVSNTPSMRRKQAVAFFEASTRQLLAAGERAGVRRHILLSIVGSDRVDLGYYAGKRRQEALALGSDR